MPGFSSLNAWELACTFSGALPEVAGDAAILVDPEEYQTMARRCADILDDSGLRKKLSSAGIKRAKLFTWQKTARQTLDPYRRVYWKSCLK